MKVFIFFEHFYVQITLNWYFNYSENFLNIIFTLEKVLGDLEAKNSAQAAARDTHTVSHALAWPTDMVHWHVAGLGKVALF